MIEEPVKPRRLFEIDRNNLAKSAQDALSEHAPNACRTRMENHSAQDRHTAPGLMPSAQPTALRSAIPGTQSTRLARPSCRAYTRVRILTSQWQRLRGGVG